MKLIGHIYCTELRKKIMKGKCKNIIITCFYIFKVVRNKIDIFELFVSIINLQIVSTDRIQK